MTRYWIPTTEQEVLARVETWDRNEEGHYLDFKSSLGHNRKANRDLAVDLASFAIDGGTLIIGVREAKDGQPCASTPVALEGLAERVEQIARSELIEPPLSVSCFNIETDADPDMGYLVIKVPPSELAPHMVQGRYCGRSHKTNIRLSNSEVVRLHQIQLERRTRSESLLDLARGTAPAHLSGRRLSVMVAFPELARDSMLQDALGDGDWRNWIRTELFNRAFDAEVLRGASPVFGTDASRLTRRAEGWSIHTAAVSDHGKPIADSDSRDYLDMLIHEDGSVVVYSGGLISGIGRTTDTILFESILLTQLYQLIRTAVTISNASTYYGRWSIGLDLRGIAGMESFTMRQRSQSLSYSAPSYRRVVHADAQELQAGERQIMERLIGPLLRAFHLSLDDFRDPAPFTMRS